MRSSLAVIYEIFEGAPLTYYHCDVSHSGQIELFPHSLLQRHTTRVRMDTFVVIEVAFDAVADLHVFAPN